MDATSQISRAAELYRHEIQPFPRPNAFFACGPTYLLEAVLVRQSGAVPAEQAVNLIDEDGFRFHPVVKLQQRTCVRGGRSTLDAGCKQHKSTVCLLDDDPSVLKAT